MINQKSYTYNETFSDVLKHFNEICDDECIAHIAFVKFCTELDLFNCTKQKDTKNLIKKKLKDVGESSYKFHIGEARKCIRTKIEDSYNNDVREGVEKLTIASKVLEFINDEKKVNALENTIQNYKKKNVLIRIFGWIFHASGSFLISILASLVSVILIYMAYQWAYKNDYSHFTFNFKIEKIDRNSDNNKE